MGAKKDLKKITKILNEFTQKEFGVKTKIGKEFLAYPDDDEINYSLIVGTINIQTFLEDAETRFPTVKADIFLWCFFHEIGHCMTDYLWTDGEQERFSNELVRMTEVEDTKEKSYWYYSMPNEFFATRWAGQYMTDHPQKVAKLWNKIQPKILKFYQKYNLTND